MAGPGRRRVIDSQFKSTAALIVTGNTSTAASPKKPRMLPMNGILTWSEMMYMPKGEKIAAMPASQRHDPAKPAKTMFKFFRNTN
ncbi:MAG: hypothetical protein ACKVHE_14140, partial [Planctomycetales bacterium]